ncbi:MAG: FxDxF family PEP-CTERM protein [Pirellulales bacterium]
MRSKFLAVVGALVLSSTAMANNVIVNQGLTGDTTYYGALHTDNVDFEDEFNFNVNGQVAVSVSLVTIGSGLQNIDFISADLNGNPLTLSPTGFVENGYTPSELNLTGPLVLKIKGKSGAAGGTFASYSGTLNVRAVPEPATGLFGAMGAMATGCLWRRRRTG